MKDKVSVDVSMSSRSIQAFIKAFFDDGDFLTCGDVITNDYVKHDCGASTFPRPPVGGFILNPPAKPALGFMAIRNKDEGLLICGYGSTREEALQDLERMEAQKRDA